MEYLEKIKSCLNGDARHDLGFVMDLHDGYERLAKDHIWIPGCSAGAAIDIFREKVLPLRMAAFSLMYLEALKRGDVKSAGKYEGAYRATEKALQKLL